MTQHVQGGSLVTQHGIGLRNFVHSLSIAYAALFNLDFRLLQELQAAGIVMLDRIAERFPYRGRKQRRVPLVSPIEVARRLLTIVYVVDRKSTRLNSSH